MTDNIDRRRPYPDTEQVLEALQARDDTIAALQSAVEALPRQIAEWTRWPSGRVSVRMGSGEVIEV